MPERHDLMGGKLHVYMREGSSHWQCASFIAGKNRRASTKEESLAKAKDFAEDWYLELMGKARYGEIKGGKTFKHAADQFVREIEALTQGERNPYYVDQNKTHLRVHLLPYFGAKAVTEITPGLVQEYRMERMTKGVHHLTGKPHKPSRSTLHKEIVCLRQVLKTANRHGWLPYLPNPAAPFRASGKVSHRGWFSPEEYRTLYEETRRRAASPLKKRWQWASEQLHDYVLFMANTGLRPDEAARLEFRDVAIVRDATTQQRILEIEVRGKRGVGYCKSMPGAVLPFQRLCSRLRAAPVEGRVEGRKTTAADREATRAKPGQTDLLFPRIPKDLFNNILIKLKLKVDRDGQPRTAYSLRHTYICMRLMEGADIYQIAKNCRTSVEMIETYYASHLKNTLDAAAINVRKAKPLVRKSGQKAKASDKPPASVPKAAVITARARNQPAKGSRINNIR